MGNTPTKAAAIIIGLPAMLYLFRATVCRVFRGYRSLLWALRCIVVHDWQRLCSFLAKYVNNNVLGHDRFTYREGKSNPITGSKWPQYRDSQNFVIQANIGGWFRKPRLWVRGEVSKCWTLKLKETVNSAGWCDVEKYLVDKNGDKLPLSSDWILTVLQANYENWNDPSRNPTTCLAAMKLLDSKFYQIESENRKLTEQGQELTNILFATLDELAESKGTFGRHPGGKAIRVSLGRKLLKFFPNDARLAAYKQNVA